MVPGRKMHSWTVLTPYTLAVKVLLRMGMCPKLDHAESSLGTFQKQKLAEGKKCVFSFFDSRKV